MRATSFWMLLQSITYSVFITFIVFPQDALLHFVSNWSPCTFINMLDSNHAIKLILVLTLAILSWTGEQWEINAGVRINADLVETPWEKSFIGNRCPGFCLDKYGTLYFNWYTFKCPEFFILVFTLGRWYT